MGFNGVAWRPWSVVNVFLGFLHIFRLGLFEIPFYIGSWLVLPKCPRQLLPQLKLVSSTNLDVAVVWTEMLYCLIKCSVEFLDSFPSWLSSLEVLVCHLSSLGVYSEQNPIFSCVCLDRVTGRFAAALIYCGIYLFGSSQQHFLAILLGLLKLPGA